MRHTPMKAANAARRLLPHQRRNAKFDGIITPCRRDRARQAFAADAESSPQATESEEQMTGLKTPVSTTSPTTRNAREKAPWVRASGQPAHDRHGSTYVAMHRSMPVPMQYRSTARNAVFPQKSGNNYMQKIS